MDEWTMDALTPWPHSPKCKKSEGEEGPNSSQKYFPCLAAEVMTRPPSSACLSSEGAMPSMTSDA